MVSRTRTVKIPKKSGTVKRTTIKKAVRKVISKRLNNKKK